MKKRETARDRGTETETEIEGGREGPGRTERERERPLQGEARTHQRPKSAGAFCIYVVSRRENSGPAASP